MTDYYLIYRVDSVREQSFFFTCEEDRLTEFVEDFIEDNPEYEILYVNEVE